MNLFETIFHVLHLGTFTCDEIFLGKGEVPPIAGKEKEIIGVVEFG
jgi:hypothetical protein